jgi:uncharacterized protein YutE (UPF0331/DUF86 family)
MDQSKKTKVPKNTFVKAEPKQEEKQEEKPMCGICIEPYNKIANTEVKCCFCDKSSCRRCIQTFLTSSTSDPHCMHCSKAWDREFIDDNLTMTYRMGDYKKHRENILLDREIALMPTTQHRAEQIREAERLQKEIIPPFDNALKELYEKQDILMKEIQRVYRLRHDATYQISLLRDGRGEKAKSESSFIRKCPDPECRGFLSTAWKCGLCSKWACPECHELKGESRDVEHTCDPNNVATAKLLAKDSRPCPGCATFITKIEGCDQMWCPQCHCAFSWRSGKKETGVVHNPHFYEWQRKQNGGVAPRVQGDVQCGGLPGSHDVRGRLIGLEPGKGKEIDYVMAFHRIIVHTEQVDLPQLHNVFNQLDNEDVRVRYLLGYMSAEEIKVEVQKREKKREKERAVRRALEVLVQAGIDLIRRIMAENDIPKKRKILDEIDALRVYINELLAKIHERTKMIVKQYSSSWKILNPFSATTKKLERERLEIKAREDAIEAEKNKEINAVLDTLGLP